MTELILFNVMEVTRFKNAAQQLASKKRAYQQSIATFGPIAFILCENLYNFELELS